jgi:hypothetical protein
MPYLEAHTSMVLTNDEKHELCEEIGKFLKLIPGKRTEITMMNIVGGCYMELGEKEQQKEPCMNIELRICGISPFNTKRDFVREVTTMLDKKYGIPPNRAFFNIFECSSWGAFGDYIDNNVFDPSLYD